MPVSTPRTLLSHGPEGLLVPREMILQFRAILTIIYPELAKKDFLSTRLCWSVFSVQFNYCRRLMSDTGIHTHQTQIG